MYTSSTWHNMFLTFSAGWDRESSQWEVLHLGMIALLTRVGSIQVTKIRLDGLNGLSWSIEKSIWGIEDCGLWITSGSNRLIRKVTLSSPSLWASFRPLFPLSNAIYLNLSMKCWNSAFNARGWRLIIVVVQLGAMKIYVTAVEAAQEKGKTGWNSVYYQNWWFSDFHPPLNANERFCGFFFEFHLVYDQTQGSGFVPYIWYITRFG
jgi:hypothetical protein